jgi:hypothetical protein
MKTLFSYEDHDNDLSISIQEIEELDIDIEETPDGTGTFLYIEDETGSQVEVPVTRELATKLVGALVPYLVTH